jgi:hypothetical protein
MQAWLRRLTPLLTLALLGRVLTSAGSPLGAIDRPVGGDAHRDDRKAREVVFAMTA